MEINRRSYFTLILLVIGVLFSVKSIAAELLVDQAYVRETLPGMKNGAAYLRVQNNSDSAVALLRVESLRIPRIEMHEHRQDGEMMAMRKVASVSVPAKGEFSFVPGGHHLMLMGIEQPLKAGEIVSFKLIFEQDITIEVEVPVTSISGSADYSRPKIHHRH